MKRIALIASAALVCACQSWSNGARIRSGGQELCAKHRIPLVTRPGFTAEGVLLVHNRPNDQFEKVDDQTPNRISDTESLTRTKNISKPAQITYCPKCEAEFQELWWGHPVDPRALLGKWRAPNGFDVLFAQDGSCSGVAYDGKPFTGRWRVLHHGLLRISVRGDDEPMFFTILSLRQSSLTIRSDEIGNQMKAGSAFNRSNQALERTADWREIFF
jgi:hypothetical protein